MLGTSALWQRAGEFSMLHAEARSRLLYLDRALRGLGAFGVTQSEEKVVKEPYWTPLHTEDPIERYIQRRAQLEREGECVCRYSWVSGSLHVEPSYTPFSCMY
jgi:hypothetical protein